ncbi:MAG: hypothetical protein PHE06_10910 [Lachnospiraceae bacterium]|nr:hypothetical protein [Lachnospiraceae bacterium]MDD3796457.1 hypothetical protein [Lachnospiraceae bacterium]
MMNYIKSECYHITHSKPLYVMASVLAGIVLLINIVLAICQRIIPDFRYGTFRFSLNSFTSVIFLMLILGAIIAGTLCSDDFKNGVVENAISYGISRPAILLGKCTVCLAVSLVLLAAVFTVYVSSAYFLLKTPEWLPLREMLSGIGASLPSAVASMILMIILGFLCQKQLNAVLWWVFIYYLLPMLCMIIGLKVDFVKRISEWMPYYFLRTEAIISFSDYQCLWDTPSGLAKCIIAGVIGIVIFLLFGIWRVQKEEF